MEIEEANGKGKGTSGQWPEEPNGSESEDEETQLRRAIEMSLEGVPGEPNGSESEDSLEGDLTDSDDEEDQ